MFCDLRINKPYFSVIKNKKKYVFIGKNYNKPLIRKIQEKKSLSSTDKSTIDNDYGDSYKWYNYEHDIEFIKYKIYIDDHIETLKKKIFVSIFDNSDEKYILPFNQLLYLKTGKIIGDHYINVSAKELLPFKIDNVFVDEEGFPKTVELIHKSTKLVYDQIDIYDKTHYDLYLINLQDVVKHLKKENIIIDSKVKYGYLRKFFPKFKLNINTTACQTKIEKLNNYFDKSEYIIDLIKSTKTSGYCSCNINQTIFEYKINLPIDLVELYYIFRKNLSNDLVFIKYKDYNWESPKISIYKPATTDIINKEVLSEWIYTWKNVGEKMIPFITSKGLMIKYYFYTFNKQRKYFTINFNEDDGNIKVELKLSFITDYGANIKDLVLVIKQFNKVLDMIDKGLKIKISKPSIKLNNGRLFLSDNIKFKFINVMTILKENIEITPDLEDFIMKFIPFISPLIEDKISTDNNIRFKYKRVTDFQNKPDIFKELKRLEKLQESEHIIISKIEDMFYKTEAQAKELYDEYKNRSGSKSIKNYGIECILSYNKVKFQGNPNVETITILNKFMMSVLSLYKNYKQYSSDKLFKKYLLTYDKFNVDIDMNNNDENNDMYDEYGSNFNNINDDFNDENNDIEEMKTENKNNYESPDILTIPKGKISSEVKMTCKDAIDELETCEDICNDSSYYLRRLQRFDSDLFGYSQKGFKRYSKICQTSTAGRYQPVILRYNPDNFPNVDKKSYSYTIKYGTVPEKEHWYICPKGWCPYCQLPINVDKLKPGDIKIRKTFKDLQCAVAKCPFQINKNWPNHNAMLRYDNTEKIRVGATGDDDGYTKYLYPGFNTKQKHPEGYCLPCCFKNNQQDKKYSAYKTFKTCLGEEINNINSDSDKIEYILSKSGVINEIGRFGLLNPVLHRLFDCTCVSGYIKKNDICFVRKGVPVNDTQSFIDAICDLVSEDKSKIIPIIDFKNYLIKKLNDILFKSLNKGLLDLTFNYNDKSSLDNFKEFLLSENSIINETLLWDLLSRPGILETDGVNIVIFNKTNILCPVSENCKTFFKKDRKTYFINKINKTYEPVYKIEKYYDSFKLFWSFTVEDNPVVEQIIDLIHNNCLNKKLNWQKILKKNKKLYDIEYDCTYENENTYVQTREHFKPKKQIVDNYNRMIGVVVDFQTTKNIFIPVRPTSIDVKLEMDDEYIIHPFKKYVKILQDIQNSTSLPVGVRYKIKSYDDNKYIIGVITNSGRRIFVTKELDKGSNIPSRIETFSQEIDDIIHNKIKKVDKRTLMLRMINYEEETFQRIRFAIANNPKMIKELKELLKIENLNKKEEQIKLLLKKYIPKLIKIKTSIDLSKYDKIPNYRQLCDKSNDIHCENNKIIVSKRNMVTGKDNLDFIIIKLTYEISRNKFKRSEIFNNKIPKIIDTSILDIYKDEIILDNVDILERINELYTKVIKEDLTIVGDFDYKQPEILEKYPTLLVDERSKLEDLNQYWSTRLSSDFKIHKKYYIQSALFESLIILTNDLTPDLDYNISDIKNVITKDINNHKIAIKNTFKTASVVDAYKSTNPTVFKNINDINDVIITIKNSYYQGSLVDILLYTISFNLGVLVLFDKPDNTTHIHFGKKDKYMILYEEVIDGQLIYNMVKKNEQYIFTKNILDDK